MKTSLILILILFNSILYCQNNFKGFVELAFDGNMAINGPYKDKPQDIGTTLNLELRIGWEWEKQMLGFAYESHDAIEYWKMALFFHHKFNSSLYNIIHLDNDRWTTYAGFELGMIRRYFENDPDWIQYGFNTGIYYNIKNSPFSLNINYNVFRGETAYRKYQKTYFDEFRHDVMYGIKYNF